MNRSIGPGLVDRLVTTVNILTFQFLRTFSFCDPLPTIFS